jgi:hypothetical protein
MVESKIAVLFFFGAKDTKVEVCQKRIGKKRSVSF